MKIPPGTPPEVLNGIIEYAMCMYSCADQYGHVNGRYAQNFAKATLGLSIGNDNMRCYQSDIDFLVEHAGLPDVMAILSMIVEKYKN